MPKWEPTIHGESVTYLMHTPTAKRRGKRRTANPAPLNMHTGVHRPPIPFGNTKQGLYVREPDGSFAWKQWAYDEAVKHGYAHEDIFVVGRSGYYLTLAEARQAIPDGAHGISYVDDYNDEFQDYFVCEYREWYEDGVKHVKDPEPFKEAHAPEPIQ